MYKIRNRVKLLFIPENSKLLLSYVLFTIGLLCVPMSAFFMLYDFNEAIQEKEYSSQLLALFIGYWAVNLTNIANFLKKS